MLDYRMYRILTNNLSYDEFRSEVYHFIQFNSVKDYIEQLLSYTIIQSLCKKQEYAKGLFLLALFDYYCAEYNVDGSEYFSEYRGKTLAKRQYPDAVYTQCLLLNSEQPKADIENLCKNDYYSQFFLKYNICEYKESNIMDFTKSQIDNLLYQVAKEYKKANKHNSDNFELIIVGDSSILLNYGFINTTTDIDSYYLSSASFKNAIKNVEARNSLPPKWFKNSFKETESFSPKIVQYSIFYKTFCGCLSVRTITDEYLIAMKLKSFRNYKSDLSDIIGILKENIEKETPITIEKIQAAYNDLYNESLSKELIDYLSTLLEKDDLEELFYNTKDFERNNRNALQEAEKTFLSYV